MKIILTVCSLALLILFFSGATCHKSNGSPLSNLPPATDTGANTFGCLIDGNVYKPQQQVFDFARPLTATYFFSTFNPILPDSPLQLTGWSFVIDAINFSDCKRRSINITLDSISNPEGQTFSLGKRQPGIGAAVYSYYTCDSGYATNLFSAASVFGQLYLKKFDQVKRIASGTFWFNTVNAPGDTNKITNGRFDVRF